MSFLVYCPVYLIVLFLLHLHHRKTGKKYKFVSDFAALDKGYGIIFNVSTSLYGALSFIAVAQFIAKSPVSFYVFASSVVYILTAIYTILIGCYPSHKNKKAHSKVGSVLFGLFFFLALTYSISFVFSQNYYILSAFSIYLLLVSFTFILKNIKKATKNLLAWEWLTLISAVIWNFVFSLTVVFS